MEIQTPAMDLDAILHHLSKEGLGTVLTSVPSPPGPGGPETLSFLGLHLGLEIY